MTWRDTAGIIARMTRHLRPLCAVALCVPALIALQPEGEAVRVPLNRYLMGHATGDSSHMQKAFLPTAHIEGIREGKLVSWTLDEYCARFSGRPEADESTRRRTIDAVDVTGNAAMARATLVHGATTFTDYFVLVKVGDDWKIANKVYTVRRANE
jgi:Putative lumazine-binding